MQHHPLPVMQKHVVPVIQNGVHNQYRVPAWVAVRVFTSAIVWNIRRVSELVTCIVQSPMLVLVLPFPTSRHRVYCPTNTTPVALLQAILSRFGIRCWPWFAGHCVRFRFRLGLTSAMRYQFFSGGIAQPVIWVYVLAGLVVRPCRPCARGMGLRHRLVIRVFLAGVIGASCTHHVAASWDAAYIGVDYVGMLAVELSARVWTTAWRVRVVWRAKSIGVFC